MQDFFQLFTPLNCNYYMDLFDWDSWRVAVISTGPVTRGRMGWEVTSTGSVTDGESSVTGQKKQARRPDGWSLSLSE